MEITIIPQTQQATGQFNFGEIKEHKPIAMPQEGGPTHAYSNLFYWAHAWSDKGSLLGEHPHQAFEIMTFVLQGSIEHYDSKSKKWIPLNAGDAQIMRAGNGLSHAEKFNAGAHIFQIWFDPNLQKTIQKASTYNDYHAKDFPVIQEGKKTTKVYKGEGAPIKMDTENIEIQEVKVSEGIHSFSLSASQIHSVFVLEGTINTGNKTAAQNDFIILKEEEQWEIEVLEESRLFWIKTPVQVSYQTYAEIYG